MLTKLTCVEGTSRKFWQAEVTGNALAVRFGRIGTSGQSKTKEFATAVEAAFANPSG